MSAKIEINSSSLLDFLSKKILARCKTRLYKCSLIAESVAGLSQEITITSTPTGINTNITNSMFLVV